MNLRVLVSGASTGIGRAIATRLAASGNGVFAGVRTPEDASELERLDSRELRPLFLDLTDAGSIEAASDEVRREGGLDALVNNAGIGVPGPLELLTDDELREQLEVNFVGQIALTRALLPSLRESSSPRVVFISSAAGRVAFPFAGAYNAAKHAIEASADTLRNELDPDGISVSLIEPGSISTPIWAKAEERLAELRDRPRGELYADRLDRFAEVLRDQDRQGGDPSDVAEVVEKALTSSDPRARYPVGVAAQIGTRVRALVPDRVFDALARRPLRS